ncbi:hypothetical protein E2C01_002505 [Portunus trituberculatus]|uniref:Uncharacterized protein n=1 Tax=Portunus trituberculatus TaxID=210409 RepID=A0A5B7CLE4_PORTR|nr:hypothetical protein [Portunus trituberculatus]
MTASSGRPYCFLVVMRMFLGGSSPVAALLFICVVARPFCTSSPFTVACAWPVWIMDCGKGGLLKPDTSCTGHCVRAMLTSIGAVEGSWATVTATSTDSLVVAGFTISFTTDTTLAVLPHLNGGRAQGEYFIASSLSVAIHVDQDVDAVLVDAIGGLPVAGDLGEVNEMLCLPGNLTPAGDEVRVCYLAI